MALIPLLDRLGVRKPFQPIVGSSAMAEGVVLVDHTTGEPLNLAQNQVVQSPDDEVVVGSISSTGVALKQDVSGWNTFIAEFASTAGSHSIVFEGNSTGLDADQWYAISGQPVDTASNSVVATRPVTTGYSAFVFSKRFTWVRARVSVYGGSGIINVRLTLTNSPTYSGPYQLNLASNVNNNSAAQSSPYGLLIAGVSRETNVIDNMTNAVYVVPTYAKGGQQVTLPYSVPDVTFQYSPPAGGITNSSTAVAIRAAAGANVRNYLTSITLSTDTLGAATDLVILDGSTAIHRIRLNTTALPVQNIVFPTPLRGSTNTALNIQTVTAVTGGVYVSATGYSGT